MNDPALIRFSLPERRTERMTGLVKASTKADWKTIQAEYGLSQGDLFTWAVELIKQHPDIFDVKEKE